MLLVPHRCTLLPDLFNPFAVALQQQKTPFVMGMGRWIERKIKGLREG
jgi:hypothetical protein